ncbi:MAG: glycosyltransferase [Bacteriovoracaceae bacterium]
MKVVLLHDWLTGFRGGERVLEAFCEMFPEAPLYTLFHDPGSTTELIEDREIHSSILNDFPGAHKHYRKMLPLLPHAVSKMRIHHKADLVLSSSSCVIKALSKPIHSKHLCYIHSPMRYIYDQFDSYFGPEAPIYQRLGAQYFRSYLTNFDQKTNENVDQFIANSGFVAQRVKDYYYRDSKVVHPFVELDDFKKSFDRPSEKGDYFLVLSAFAPNKKIDLAIETFNKLGLELRVIGGGQQEKYLKSIAKENIKFLGKVSREEVLTELSGARALIFPGVEDFGIVPLESLASGTPIIAYKAGGVLESLNQKTADFFEEQTIESLSGAVKNFDDKRFQKSDLVSRAKEFSKESFKSKILSEIDSLLGRSHEN